MRELGPIWKVFFWKETEPASLLGVNKLARAGDTHTARSGRPRDYPERNFQLGVSG